jgi:hypothetical protein
MPGKKDKENKTSSIVIGEDISFHSLHEWYKESFEKLGMMILAKKSGNKYKIDAYIHSLDHLKHNLERKLGKLKDVDKKQDILILWTNLNVLIEHAKKDLL